MSGINRVFIIYFLSLIMVGASQFFIINLFFSRGYNSLNKDNGFRQTLEAFALYLGGLLFFRVLKVKIH